MKVATCIVFLSALACLLHQTSAQQFWWERNPDGSAAVSTARTTAAGTAGSSPTAAPPASTTTNCRPCPVTPEYNPVCGDDKVTYSNPGMLECAQSCGRNVQLLFHGRCEKLA